MNRRPSALATPTRPGVDIGHLTGSAYQRNSCRRSSEIVSRPSSPVSQARAAFASPAASGSSRVRVSSAWLSVIMRPVCRRPMREASARYLGRVPGIYDEPEFYEAACAYRDVPAEVNALLRWSDKHRGPHSAPPRSVLDL